ncbi:hypothetical protein TEA_000313 [Camellia sinensis var. sinensis]|uniref:Uncharacterized protein n=1 Tax=Camellia sinensis var. sinensis TaxID=542762 RepID=A0A4S4EYI3_CAMSN|nr:hypothetical protein TEA_000313 [Camellia sinensis var. sinensis]
MTNRPRRVVNSNLSDCIAQSKALSTVENSAFKDKQQRDGPLQSATARTMRKDDLKMKGTEQRQGRRRKERQQQPYPYLADDALEELKVAYEALKEHNISSEAANIEVIILYEFIKQHVCDIEAKKGELLGLYETVRQHSTILGAENSELVKKLGDYQPRISVLERQLDEMHSSLDEMASSISNQVEVLHKEVAERASILEQEWNSTVGQVVQTVEKLDALNIGSRVAASVDAATKVIDNLQEKLEASGKDPTAMCSSYKDMIEKFNDLHRKNELAIGVLHGVHGNLERLVNDSCQHVEQSQIINQNENLIDPLHLDNYDTLMEQLAVLLGERLQFKSMNDKLNLELIDMAKEMEKLKKTGLDSDTILYIISLQPSQLVYATHGKVRNQEHIEGEIRRILEDLVHDLLKDSVTENVVSAGSSTECLEQLLKKLSEKYTALALEKPILDKFVIGDDFDNDEQAQQILDRKAYLLYKDWRYNLKQEFLELEEKGVDDPYSHPPSGVSLDDWRYLIDVAWKDESHLKRSKAGKANRAMLPYNHTSGSRSFPIAMSLMANEDGQIDFPEFYKKSHKSKKTGDWIDPKCGELHDDMVNLQVVATDAGLPLTHEELSRQVLGAKKNYLRGCGIGPQPSSTASNVARARDKHMESMRTELEALREERERDHEELLKEKEERQRDHEELLKEKEERQRDREEIMRERKELMKQIEEEKKAREAQQVQLNHLNDVVSRLTTLLQGSDGHPTIR